MLGGSVQRPRGDAEEELNMFEYYGSKGSTTFIDLSSGRQIGPVFMREAGATFR